MTISNTHLEREREREGGTFREIPLAIDNDLVDIVITNKIQILEVVIQRGTTPMIKPKDDWIFVIETPRRVLNYIIHITIIF